MVLANIESRLNQRRNKGTDFLFSYIKQVLHSEQYNSKEPTTIEHFCPYLTAEELAAWKKEQEERAHAEAEAKVRAEAEQKLRREEWERYQASLRAYWEKNPPDPLTAVPEFEVDEEGKDLFDIFARYRFARVECAFDGVDYYRDYGEERMGCLVGVEIKLWLSEDIPPEDIEVIQLPGDDENGTIGEFIYDSVRDVATTYLCWTAGKIISGGTVTFNVPKREVSVSTEVKVTTEEVFEDTWTV